MATGTAPMRHDVDEQLPAAARRVLVALVLGGTAAILDSTIVTIALDRLTVALETSTSTIQWVVTAYLLAVAVAVPLSGWAQARFGGKRAWIAALLLFVTSSAACAAAWDAGSLITFRVCQGLGAGLIFPLMQTLAMQAVGTRSGKVMGRAVATITVPLALGPILGPVVGGLILNWLDWRWIFLINVPLVATGIVLAWRLLEPDRPAEDSPAVRLDVVGLCLLTPGVAGILLGLSDVGSHAGVGRAETWAPLGGGVALLAAFVGWALHRRGRAVVDITLLRTRSLSAACAVLFTAGATLYAGMVLLPLYWQQVRGASVLDAALLLVPQGVGALLSRALAGAATSRFGSRAVTVGAFLVTAIGTLPFAFADAHTSQWWLGAVLFVRGLGAGAIIIAPLMTAYADVSHPQMPHATMMTRITQQVGASFGAAVVAVVLQSLLVHGATAGFHGTFWWTIAITLVALVPALAFRRETLQGP